MIRLGVNIDHVATVRQARRGRQPDPVDAALACQRAGAHRIVCHLREDRRHIQDADVRRLKFALKVPLNLEMSVASSVVRVARSVKPFQVTLVPERRQELTTEGGLDIVRMAKTLRPLVRAFERDGIGVSLFVDPVRDQLTASRDIGAPIVELHTGRYANASPVRRSRELGALRRAAVQAEALGLAVAAGHGLDYQNVRPVCRIAQIEELNIGFSIISRALAAGLNTAVKDMLTAMRRSSSAHARRS